MNLSERRALHTGFERRSCAFQLVGGEMRGAGAPALSGWTLDAYASVTDTPYTVHDSLGPFTETVHRGAFGDTLARGADVAFRVNHEGLALGRTRSGTLQLAEDMRGLRYSVSLDPENPNAVALRSAVNRRDVTESSFAFLVTRQEWSADYMERSIFGVDLDRGDVSAVTFGASPATGDDGNATTLRAEWRGASDYVGLTPAIKAKFVSDLANVGTNPTVHVAQWLHRCNQWAATTYPKGCTYSDVKWMAQQCVNELKKRDPKSTASMAGFPGPSAGTEAAGPSDKKSANLGTETRCQAGQAALDAAGQLKQRAAGRYGESRSPLHAPTTGSHTHSHPAFGSQGGDKTHTHTHSHDGEASHDHSHDAAAMIANGDVAGQSMDQPSAESLAAYNAALLGLPNYDVETRLTILRLKAGPPPAPLSSSEKLARAIAAGQEADRVARRRIEQYRRGTR